MALSSNSLIEYGFQPVSNVYALVVTPPDQNEHQGYDYFQRLLNESHGEEDLIWDGIAETLTMMYSHHPGELIPDNVFEEIVDVYFGRREHTPLFRQVMTEFLDRYRGAIEELYHAAQGKGERIQAAYPVRMNQTPLNGFLVFECTTK